MTVLELWLIRHGETDWNVQGRIHGSSDVPLNATGLQQARRLAPRLAGVHFDGLYASDLGRARVTAETALPGASVRLDPRLRELAYGIFEGKSWTTLDGDEAIEARRWQEDRYGRCTPGGESFADLEARVAAFRAELPARGRVIAFTHGGAIRAALYAALGQPVEGVWRLKVDNTSITRLAFDHRGTTLVTVNDHAHLDGVAVADDGAFKTDPD